MQTRRRHSEDIKRQAVKRVLEDGWTVPSVAREIGVDYTTAYKVPHACISDRVIGL